MEDNIVNAFTQRFYSNQYDLFINHFKSLTPENKLGLINYFFENEDFSEKDYSFFITQLLGDLKSSNLMSQLPLYVSSDAISNLLELLVDYHLNNLAIDVISNLTKNADKFYDYMPKKLFANEELKFAAFNHTQMKDNGRVGFKDDNVSYEKKIKPILQTIFASDELFYKYQEKISILKIHPEVMFELSSKDEVNKSAMTVILTNYDKYLANHNDMFEILKQNIFIKEKGTYNVNRMTFRGIVRNILPLLDIASNQESTLAKNKLTPEYIVSKLRNVCFADVTSFNLNVIKNKKYKVEILKAITNNPSYDNNLAINDYFSTMKQARDTTHTNCDSEGRVCNSIIYFNHNALALYFATEIAEKFESVAHANYDGYTALTLYLETVNQISINADKQNQEVFKKNTEHHSAQCELDLNLLNKFYEYNPKLFLQADSFGKYPWDYIDNRIISKYVKFNNSDSLQGPLHQYELFLESVGMLKSYEQIKELSQEEIPVEQPVEVEVSHKKVSFFMRLLGIFSGKKEVVENLPELENIQVEVKEDLINNFSKKLSQSAAMLNTDVMSKLTDILTLSKNINELIQDDKNSIEHKILIKNTLSNYLPTIMDNFIAMNELKVAQDDSQATKITLEQLNVLEQKLLHTQEELNTLKQADVMAKVESFGSFLNAKTQPTMKM